MDNVPYIPIYPGDLHRHIGFLRASHATIGVYLRLLLLMGSSERRGALVHAGQALSKGEAAALAGGDQKATLQAIEELLKLRLFQIGADGAIESPELIKAERDRLQNAARQRDFKDRKRREREEQTGRQAGNDKGNAPVTAEVTQPAQDRTADGNDPVICMSSSSSSFMSSSCHVSPTEIHAPPPVETETVESIFEEILGRKLSILQSEKAQIVDDLSVFRATCQDWRLNGYSSRNVAGLLEAYKANRIKPQNGSLGKGNAYVGAPSPRPAVPAVAVIDPPARVQRAGQWGRILDDLDRLIGVDHVRTWFEPLKFAGVEDGAMRLVEPDAIFGEFIQANYAAQFREAIVTVFGDECAVRFEQINHTEA